MPDLAQPAAHAQPVQRQRRVRPGDHHQVDAVGQQPDQGVDGVDRGGRGDLVEVLEHHHHRGVQLLEREQQPVEEGLVQLGRRPHPRQGRAVEPGAVQRRQEERPQPLRVVAVGAERRPGHPYAGAAAPAYPVDDEVGLAGARSAAHQRHRATAAGVHLLQQPGPRQDVRRGTRRRGAGAQQRPDGAGRGHRPALPQTEDARGLIVEPRHPGRCRIRGATWHYAVSGPGAAWRGPSSGTSGGVSSVAGHRLTLHRDVGQDLVEPSRQPPGGLAEQHDDGRARASPRAGRPAAPRRPGRRRTA